MGFPDETSGFVWLVVPWVASNQRPLGNSFTDCALYFLCEQRLDGVSVAAVKVLGGL